MSQSSHHSKSIDRAMNTHIHKPIKSICTHDTKFDHDLNGTRINKNKSEAKVNQTKLKRHIKTEALVN